MQGSNNMNPRDYLEKCKPEDNGHNMMKGKSAPYKTDLKNSGKPGEGVDQLVEHLVCEHQGPEFKLQFCQKPHVYTHTHTHTHIYGK
jgi:hypothetical protein